MRIIFLFLVAVLFGPATVLAQNSPASDQSSGETLPLFAKNHCETHKNPANQLICADPELSAAAVKLSAAIEERLNRLADRRVAIEENAGWVRDRNQSCGIFRGEQIR